jgi:ribonuclease Y
MKERDKMEKLLVNLLYLAGGVVISLIFFFFFFLWQKKQGQDRVSRAQAEAEKIIEEAKKEAAEKKREARMSIKDEIFKAKADLDKEMKERRAEVNRLERRLAQREENLERKLNLLEKREGNILSKEKEYNLRIKKLGEREKELKKLQEEEKSQLEKISRLSVSEAKKLLLSNLIEEAKYEAAKRVREIEEEAKQTAEKKAKNILALTIAKCAADYVAETTISTVPLPNDEIKGRIIGREGRNIRTFEMATGVDLIIDDTPEAVVISGFDPVRREIARLSLEKLIADGRIHPTRIEEVVKKTQEEISKMIIEEGEKASFDTGVYGLHPEIIKLLGRLKYRMSYGQNVLQHSLEVAHLAGSLAGELGVDVKLAKRAALIHDIGKAVDREVEGTHIELGADLARKYGEGPRVINAILAHHEGVPPESVEAVIVQAADSLSASRPGARKEILETYLKRIEKLEKLVASFPGVEKTFAVQAGREVRVMVDPGKIDDDAAYMLVKDITKKIKAQLEYPGQIKVSVIRELRVVDYAK